MTLRNPEGGVEDALGRLRQSRGRQYWRSLEELCDLPAFRARVAAEFPALARVAPDVDRRSFFKCLAGAIAIAGLDGCERQPAEDSLAYVRNPDGSPPGAVRHYATAWELDGIGQPVLGKCRDGRPIKLEGNPRHPASGGATDAFTQAALLGLYDPARSGAPSNAGNETTWDAFDAMIEDERARLDAGGGAGLRLLTGPVGSPTLLRQIAAMRARWPQMTWHVHAPLGVPDRAEQLDPARAATIVSLDADPLGNGPFQTWNARAWSSRRRGFQQGEGNARLMVAEPTPTLTGAAAQDRLAVSHGRIALLVSALEAQLAGGPPVPALSVAERTWISAATAALRAARGSCSLLLGAHHPPALRARVRALQAGLGMEYRAAPTAATAAATARPDLEALRAAMASGRVDMLVVLESNPVYSAPAGASLARSMRGVRRTVHAGLHADETAAACQWHAPLAHLLESWGDVACADGSAAPVQPLVRPFLDVRSRHALLAGLMGEPAADGQALVRQTWPGEDAAWREALLSGAFPAMPAPAPEAPPAPAPADAAVAGPAPGPAASGHDVLELIFRPDPTIHDGSFAANPWLQEMPKPLTKLTWENAVHVSPALAERLDIGNEDMVALDLGPHQMLVAPAWIVPGQAANTVLVHLGYGRRAGGAVGEGAGFDAYGLRRADSPWQREDVALRKAGGRQTLACTQTHWAIDGSHAIRSVARADEALPRPEEQANFYPPLARKAGEPAWGMAIDLDLCIGCNACAAACVAENNVPMVGKEQVAKGREMHWLRIDRYYDGAPEAPGHAFQPVPCMHCEDAPCEMGCPVNATVHSPEGLNLQVYNRCIGTRTCSAFCPYKVRRFNWLDYTRDAAPELVAQRNPEVTVRDRGVMEKCTYCIQRIEDVRIEADKAGRPVGEGEVRTACQQACPTQAIVFGDIARPDSAVSRRKASGRDYSLLAEANTRPRTTYGAKIEGGENDAGKNDAGKNGGGESAA